MCVGGISWQIPGVDIYIRGFVGSYDIEQFLGVASVNFFAYSCVVKNTCEQGRFIDPPQHLSISARGGDKLARTLFTNRQNVHVGLESG
jgi:hypothetical protein